MKKVVMLIVFGLIINGCVNPMYKTIKELENTKFDNSQDIITSRKALNLVEKDLLDSLKLLFPEDIILQTNDTVWSKVMSDAKLAILEGITPPDSLLQISNSVNLKDGKKQTFAKISFPFVNKKENAKTTYVNMVVSENKLYGLFVGKYPFGMHILK